jgi:acetyltransferase-like isoleucine patch superfamily enzyme
MPTQPRRARDARDRHDAGARETAGLSLNRQGWSPPAEGRSFRGEWRAWVASECKDLLKRIRVFMLRRRYRDARLGKGFHVGRSVSIGAGFIAGDYVYIGPYSQIPPHVSIGHYSSLSAHVAIVGADHNYEPPGVPIVFAGRPPSRVTTIGSDVLVGHGAILMRGITIGNGAIVGAGAVVTKDVPAYAVMAGVPATILRYRFDAEGQAIHEAMLAAPTTRGMHPGPLG